MGKIILLGLAVVGLFTIVPIVLPILLVMGFAFLIINCCTGIMDAYYHNKYHNKK